MAATLAIVVVNYGSSALLEENLVATSAALPDARVYAFDNHTSDAEADTLTRLAGRHGWTAILNPTNDGFGDGVNQAAALAFDRGAEDVLVLNPDATIDAGSVAALQSAVAQRRLTLAAPVIRTPAGSIWFDGADLYLDSGETRGRARRPEHLGASTFAWLSGACLLLTREVFEATGGFDPGYFLYWEDVDLCWRAAQKGVDLVVVDDAAAVHDAGGTQQGAGSRGKSRTYYFHNARNRLLFAAHNLDRRSIRRWLLTTPRASWRILLRGGRRQVLSDPGVVWAVARGSLAGIRAALTRLVSRAPASS